MPHRLCELPPIPLSFNLAIVLPRQNVYALAYINYFKIIHVTFIVYRRGLPEYLILFAPHAFILQRQLQFRQLPSPLVFLMISQDVIPTSKILLSSIVFKKFDIKNRSKVKLQDFIKYYKFPPTDTLRPVNKNNAHPLRITAAAGTKLAGISLIWVLSLSSPTKELYRFSLHHSCGIARSGVSPLSNIPHCCL